MQHTSRFSAIASSAASRGFLSASPPAMPTWATITLSRSVVSSDVPPSAMAAGGVSLSLAMSTVSRWAVAAVPAQLSGMKLPFAVAAALAW